VHRDGRAVVVEADHAPPEPRLGTVGGREVEEHLDRLS